MDIIPNKHDHRTISYHWHKYYLLVCDVYSKYSMLLGMKDDKASSVVEALNSWIATHQCMPTFYPGFLQNVRSDAGTAFTSKEFIEACEEQHIRFSHAAPRHQEMNGLAERTWQSLRELAFSMMTHAQVGDEFYNYALQHAWKVFNCLPVRGLEIEGRPATPLECSLVTSPVCPSSRCYSAQLLSTLETRRMMKNMSGPGRTLLNVVSRVSTLASAQGVKDG